MGNYDWAAGAANAASGAANMGGGLLSLLGGPAGPLIGGGISALSSLFAPNPYKQKEKWDAKAQQRRINAVNENLKPDQPRYNLSKNLPQFDELLKKITLGLANESFGGERGKGMGIDFGSLLAALNQSSAPAQVPNMVAYGNKRAPDAEGPDMYAGALMRKYGLER